MGLFSSPQTLPARRRASAVWLLALFVLGQLLAFAHHVGTDHSICDDRGERIHGHCHHETCSPEAPKAGVLAAATPTPELEGSGQAELEPQSAGHEHGDSCSILTPNEGRGWVPHPPILSYRHVNVLRVQPEVGADRAMGGIPLYRLAPKQSPPELC